MDIEEARQIWKGSDMSESELIEWVRMVNQRSEELVLEKDKGLPLGETIEISSQQALHSDK